MSCGLQGLRGVVAANVWGFYVRGGAQAAGRSRDEAQGLRAGEA